MFKIAVIISRSTWYTLIVTHIPEWWSKGGLIKPNKTETCCNNKILYLYTCFYGNFKYFVLLLELIHNGTSSIKISYLSLGLPSSFFTSLFLISWCIFMHASCLAYVSFLKYFVENRLFSSSLYNFLNTSDTCSLTVALFSSEPCSIIS
jgi:hypothetical protein